MVSIVADTNVYISALNFGGIPDEVLALARMGHIQLYISRPILQEIAGVLERKFLWSEPRASQAVGAIEEFAILVSPEFTIHHITEDEPDNRILECAVEAKANFIISGDQDLLRLRTYEDIKILKPREFLEALHDL